METQNGKLGFVKFQKVCWLISDYFLADEIDFVSIKLVPDNVMISSGFPFIERTLINLLLLIFG